MTPPGDTMRTACCLPLSLILLWTGLPAATQNGRPPETRTIPLDVLCGPQAALGPPSDPARVLGGLERVKTLFGTGETVLVDAGTSKGIRAGQRYYVRRVIEDRFAGSAPDARPRSIHTAAWITILDAQTDVSVARIVEACDGVMEGDYIEPLVLPPAGTARPQGSADFSRPGTVILGDDRRQLGATGSLMVIDRGSDHGLRVGQRLTIFRETAGGSGPIVTIGEAVIVSTQADTSAVRIEQSREAVQVGDRVALHR